VAATKGGTTLASFGYTLDDAGLRTAVASLAGTESYGYDNLYRLTGVTYPDATTQAYTYDPVGNRQTKVQGGTTTTYGYDTADRMTAAGADAYTYDAAGRQLTRTSGAATTTYCYDVLGRLTAPRRRRPARHRRPRSCASTRRRTFTDGAGHAWGPTPGSPAGVVRQRRHDHRHDRPGALPGRARRDVELRSHGPNGTYTVTLKFAEIYSTAAGQRSSTSRSTARPC